MYHEFYGLNTDPFRLSPDHKFCLRHNTFAKARAYMQFAADRAEGFVMITGRPGTGKTTLIEDVLAELDGSEVTPAKLVSSQLDAEDLLHMVAYNFGLNPKGQGKSSILLELQGTFAAMQVDGHRPLLIIDEAQALTHAALEELRLLTNLRIGPQPMLQIFLVGQEELRAMVLAPDMEQLHQRLIASCHLEPLNLEQTAEYVMHRLKIAGWTGRPAIRPEIFPPLYRFSGGIPRRINLFMGRLMLHDWLERKDVADGADAREVLRELHQEQLVPLPIGNLSEDDLNFDLAKLDPGLLMPDQAIGDKLPENGRMQHAPRKSPLTTPPPVQRRPARIPLQSAAPPQAAHPPSPQPPGKEPEPPGPMAETPTPPTPELESPWQEDRRLEGRRERLHLVWVMVLLVLILGLGAIVLLLKIRQEGLVGLPAAPFTEQVARARPVNHTPGTTRDTGPHRPG